VTRLAALACVVTVALAPTDSAAASQASTSVRLDRTSITAQLGGSFVFHSTISNPSPAPLSGAIAHLNVLSLQRGVYVDPEDWSSHRTRYLATIPPHSSLRVTWKLKAVNSGSFAVYIAVLPANGEARPPIAGPTLHVTVAHRRTLNPGGALPLVLAIPALLGALTLGLRRRRRATRKP
jgi:hypothetical protein